jgi:perosamine synthetase
MSNVQAALGCAQLERINELVSRKRDIFFRYRDSLLSAFPEGKMNPEPHGTVNSYWMPTLILPKAQSSRRDGLLETMRESGIDARRFFPPLSDTPVFKDLCNNDTPRAHDLTRRAFNLPSYHDMTTADQERVISAILQGLRA